MHIYRYIKNISIVDLLKTDLVLLFIITLLLLYPRFRIYDNEYYLSIYNSIPFLEMYKIQRYISNNSLEPFFVIIFSFLKTIGLSYLSSIFILSFLSIMLIYRSMKVISINITLSLVVYLFLYIFSLQLGQIRQAIAFSFILFSLIYVKEGCLIRFLICVLIGFLFHYSAIIFFPVYFILKIELKKKYLHYFFLFSIFLFLVVEYSHFSFLFMPGDIIGINKLKIYSVFMVGSYNILSVIEKLIFGIVFYFLFDNEDINDFFPFFKKLVFIYFFGFFIFFPLINSSTIVAYRGSLYFFGVIIFLIPPISFAIKKSNHKKMFFIGIITFLVSRFALKMYLI